MKNLFFILLLLAANFIVAQDDEDEQRARNLRDSKNLTWDGNKELSEDNFKNCYNYK